MMGNGRERTVASYQRKVKAPSSLARSPRKVGKPLRRQLGGSCSARRGPYRILYKIKNPENWVEILRVDHRADVYRNG